MSSDLTSENDFLFGVKMARVIIALSPSHTLGLCVIFFLVFLLSMFCFVYFCLFVRVFHINY